MSFNLVKDFSKFGLLMLLVLLAGNSVVFPQKAKTTQRKQTKSSNNASDLNTKTKKPPIDLDEAIEQAKIDSKDAKNIAVIMIFRKEDMPVSKRWKEKTQKYFSDVGITSTLYILETLGTTSAMFYINGKAAYDTNIPFKKDALDKVISLQRDAEALSQP